MSDPQLGAIMSAWQTAIAYVDATEPRIRDSIEGYLMGVSPEKSNLAKKRIDGLMTEITDIRTPAIKQAFRHLRDNLPKHGDEERLEIYGETLATHAFGILGSDVERLRRAVESGVLAGLGNTDIAHLAIGSRALNGSDGQTEQTRQNILRLAKGYLRQRKGGMVRPQSRTEDNVENGLR